MTRRRRAGPRFTKKDATQDWFVQEIRKYPGVSVFETNDVGGGFGDVVVGFRGQTMIVEIKVPGKRDDLTENEKKFRDTWTGAYMVACIPDEVLDAMGFFDGIPKGVEK